MRFENYDCGTVLNSLAFSFFPRATSVSAQRRTADLVGMKAYVRCASYSSVFASTYGDSELNDVFHAARAAGIP
jgi:hypothetical protein